MGNTKRNPPRAPERSSRPERWERWDFEPAGARCDRDWMGWDEPSRDKTHTRSDNHVSGLYNIRPLAVFGKLRSIGSSITCSQRT